MRTPTLALRHHHGCTLTPHPTPFFVARMFIWSFAFFFGIRCLAVAGQASGHKGFACGFSVRGSLSEHRRLDAKDAKGQHGPRTMGGTCANQVRAHFRFVRGNFFPSIRVTCPSLCDKIDSHGLALRTVLRNNSGLCVREVVEPCCRLFSPPPDG